MSVSEQEFEKLMKNDADLSKLYDLIINNYFSNRKLLISLLAKFEKHMFEINNMENKIKYYKPDLE